MDSFCQSLARRLTTAGNNTNYLVGDPDFKEDIRLTALLRTAVPILAACLVYGQDKPLTFEVASVKPAAPLVRNERGPAEVRARRIPAALTIHT
jgi:hypothetical protein